MARELIILPRFRRDYRSARKHPEFDAETLGYVFDLMIAGDRRLLGGQIFGAYGKEVSKRVDTFATALHFQARVDELNDLDLSYTPPLSSPWDPVQVAAQAWLSARHRRSKPPD